MKWNMIVGALVVSVGLCSQSFGAELLDRMLGLNTCGCSCGCAPKCCEKSCCQTEAPSCGCAAAAPAPAPAPAAAPETPSCGCAAAPSCGCAAPSCGCSSCGCKSCGCGCEHKSCGCGCGCCDTCAHPLLCCPKNRIDWCDLFAGVHKAWCDRGCDHCCGKTCPAKPCCGCSLLGGCCHKSCGCGCGCSACTSGGCTSGCAAPAAAEPSCGCAAGAAAPAAATPAPAPASPAAPAPPAPPAPAGGKSADGSTAPAPLADQSASLTGLRRSRTY